MTDPTQSGEALEALISAAGRSELPTPELRLLFAARLEEARAAWPAFGWDPPGFARFWGERLGPGGLGANVEHARVVELYHAFRVLQGDRAAVEELARRYADPIRDHIARTFASADLADEVMQRLLEEIVARPDAGRLATYGGRGSLAGWLRMTATWIARDLQRLERRRRAAAPVASQPGDPELGYLKAHYRADFEQAFAATLGQLSVEQCNVLRLYFLDGMSSEAIARLFRVNGSTVRRWLAGFRREIFQETRRRLAERVGLGPEELESVLRLVRSQLNLSLGEQLNRDGD
jgi:RNA polymerase sigma-70 factor (ECF subfamily)